ncbi:hypothetical protein [Streptomyces sp. NPDC058476]|uniref:hypothetical protein n=1 Tax=Streptomyces sp. NPDC058476 TaxID=3346519 RepID=UPI0036606E3E
MTEVPVNARRLTGPHCNDGFASPPRARYPDRERHGRDGRRIRLRADQISRSNHLRHLYAKLGMRSRSEGRPL